MDEIDNMTVEEMRDFIRFVQTFGDYLKAWKNRKRS